MAIAARIGTSTGLVKDQLILVSICAQTVKLAAKWLFKYPCHRQ